MTLLIEIVQILGGLFCAKLPKPKNYLTTIRALIKPDG